MLCSLWFNFFLYSCYLFNNRGININVHSFPKSCLKNVESSSIHSPQTNDIFKFSSFWQRTCILLLTYTKCLDMKTSSIVESQSLLYVNCFERSCLPRPFCYKINLPVLILKTTEIEFLESRHSNWTLPEAATHGIGQKEQI